MQGKIKDSNTIMIKCGFLGNYCSNNVGMHILPLEMQKIVIKNSQ